MIQELVEFGKRVTKGKSMALKEEPFVIDLVINEEGEFQRFIVGEKRTIETEVLTAKKGKARFLLDKSEEVLGIGEGAEKKHKLFMKKLELFRGVQSLDPIFKFYDENNENGIKKSVLLFEKLDKKAQKENMTFMVDTTRLLERDEIRNAIIEKYAKNERKLSNGKICSICGTSNSPVLDEPHGLVKMPKGQTAGCALISYNENAFESYGLKGNLNSSICRDCARNYIEGLRFLLSDGYNVEGDDKQKAHFHYNHRIKISDNTVVLFWTREDTDVLDPFSVYDTPDATEIKNLFDSVWNGKQDIGSVVDTNMFYTCTLSSAAARIAVRDWTAICLGEYKKNLAEWFQDIEMVNNTGELTYSPLKWLINATQRDKKTGEKIKADLNSRTRIGTILWNASIRGHSYKIPLEVLQYVLNRIWKKDKFSLERAALIKLVINRNTNKNMKSTLEETNTSVAYLCGRLFAVIEAMQWKAIGNVNNGVKERYFAATASQPSILGTLLTKNVPIYQHKIGGYLAKELNEIAGRISEVGSFPQRFTTIEQGEFALGYYFQRNHKKDNDNQDNINS
ncbi:MAG: type I-C CRISPR-associated protein Cas8c/Csd1 [Prevotella sp.]|nr:type I-C CRISPR-associated protein Cas8c/Csd1 [Prevotella sp.]